MKFTDFSIRNLKPQSKRYIDWKENGNGLGVRVSVQGKKTFVYQYRFEGKSRLLTLGAYPQMTLAEAHLAHAEAMAKLHQKIDPGTEATTKKIANRRAPTVAQLAEEFLNRWCKLRRKTWQEDHRRLQKNVLPSIGTMKAAEVRKRDLVLLLDAIHDRGAPIEANRVYELIRKMYNFAASRDIVEHSPCVGIEKIAKETPRDRVLSDTEIRTLWTIDSKDFSTSTTALLHFQLAIAQRKGEIIGCRWREIDLTNKLWIIPAERTKNKKPHYVPLSAIALEILSRIEGTRDANHLLFPGPDPNIPMGRNTPDRALRRFLIREGVQPRFTPHDLRRTAASKMASLGVSRLTIEKVLNHTDQTVTGIYDRHNYLAEKRLALEKWGNTLQQIVTGQSAKIINLT